MKKRPSVVLISSSPAQLETLRGWLAESGLKVRAAESCAEADQEWALEPAPCLVISDASLSDGNWYSVLRRLVDYGLDCEFVVTGAGSDGPSGRMLASGVETVLPTPLDKSEILRVVARALRPAELGKKKATRPRSAQQSTATRSQASRSAVR